MTTILTQSYYSNLAHSDTLIMPDGGMPLKFLSRYSLTCLHIDVFCRVIEPLRRVDLTQEEYVLLKTIMLCNPAAKELSQKGRKLLQNESERYGKLLLGHMQARLGLEAGAVKYSKLMEIFEAMAHFAQRHREFFTLCMVSYRSLFDVIYFSRLKLLCEVIK